MDKVDTKQTVATFIVCMMLATTLFVVTADTVRAPPSDDYTYLLDQDGNAIITGYTGTGGAITIPSVLDGHPTLIIDYEAFNSEKGHLITSVIIPDSVTSIKSSAFYNCTLLESVTIGRNVIDMGQYVFKYCSSLTSITLLMHDPPESCDCWIENTSNALLGHAYIDSHFPLPGQVWKNMMMGAYITPTADFTYSAFSPTELDVILFSDLSTDSDGAIASWSWDFGDGGTSTLRNPTHEYPDNGYYSVILTVTDDDGLTDSISTDVFVGNVWPSVDFTFSPTSPTDQDLIQFTDLSSDADGIITSWSWEFGDGATSSLQNPTHHYTAVGSYRVNLTVWDDDGGNNPASKDIVVSNVSLASNVPPTADFTSSPSLPTASDVVQFTDASTDPDGTIVSWSWNFGDGTYSTSKNPQHSYNTHGQYTVVLEVTDNDGAKKSISKIITIHQLEAPNNPPSPPLKPFGQSSHDRGVDYILKSSAIDPDGDLVRLRCDWGDGSFSNWSEFDASNTTVSFSHAWSSSSIYSIRVIAQDNKGLNSSWSTPLTVTVSDPKADNETQNVNKPKTPGFELVFIIGAIAVALLLWRKKRNI